MPCMGISHVWVIINTHQNQHFHFLFTRLSLTAWRNSNHVPEHQIKRNTMPNRCHHLDSILVHSTVSILQFFLAFFASPFPRSSLPLHSRQLLPPITRSLFFEPAPSAFFLRSFHLDRTSHRSGNTQPPFSGARAWKTDAFRLGRTFARVKFPGSNMRR